MLSTPFKGANLSNITQRFHVGHKALDWVSGYGTPLCAMEDVKVLGITPEAVVEGYEGLIRGYGVRMKGLETGLEYLFWHCLPIFPVWGGDIVKGGQIVALMGNSGNVFTGGIYVPLEERLKFPHKGTHLHLEVFENGVAIDPIPRIAMLKSPIYTVSDQLSAIAKMVGKAGKLLARKL